MSKEVEERVVEMRFDNKNFEKNVADTMSTLDKLKEKLNFRGIERSFDGISSAARDVNMSPLSNAIDTVMSRFSALDVMAFTTLQNITNKAIDAGEKLVKSLTVDQIGSGWHKYDDETKAVQTIVNATGKSIEEVEDELARLSWFTDETSYSYIDMVSNIGKFTSMQIPLKDSVTAMEGIANWAAVSGQGINEASRAMYNLSQAMGAGAVKLQDWKSIENANMATAEFKQTAIDTAKSMGLLTKAGKDVKGNMVDLANFSQTLQDGWFTKDVLMATLQKYGAYSDKVYDFMQNATDASLTCAEAMDLVSAKGTELGAKAFKAAQEAKTLTEAIDSVKDAVSTGWKDTFKIIFGNYEQAKTLWTDVANDLWDIFASGSEGRNDLLKEWSESGGHDHVVGVLKNALEGLKQVIDIVKESLRDIFPTITAERLKTFSESLNKFSKKLILSDEKADKLRRSLKGLFAILDIVRIVITDMVQIGLALFNTLLGNSTDKIGDMTANIGDSIVSFRDWIKEHDHSVESIKKICDRIATVRKAIKDWIDDHVHLRESLSKLREHIQNAIEKIGAFAKKFKELPAVQTAVSKVKDILAKFFDKVKEFFSDGYDGIKNFIEYLKTLDGFSFENIKYAFIAFKEIVLDNFSNIEGGVDKLKSAFGTLKDSIAGNFKKAGDSMDGFRDKIVNFGKLVKDKAEAATDFSLKWATTSHNLKTYANNAKKKLKEIVDVGDLLSIALGGTLIMSIKNISDAFKTLKSFTSPVDALAGVFKGLQEIEKAYAKKVSVDAMTKMIKGIAIALGILVGIVFLLSRMDEKAMWRAIAGLGALAAGLLALVAAFAAINKYLGSLKIDVGIQASVIAIAAAVFILVKAAKALDEVQNVGRNIGIIAGLVAGLGILGVAIAKLTKNTPMMASSALVIIAIAGALYIMVAALVKLNDLDTSHIVKKLFMLSIAMGYLIVITKLSKGIGIGGALAIVAVGFALGKIIKVFANVGKMDTSGIIKNLWVLVSAVGILATLMIASSLAGKNASKGGIGILAMSVAILILIKAMQQIADMPIKDLNKGLKVVSLLMLVFGAVVALSHFAGENAVKAGVMILLMSGALLIIAGAVNIFAKIPEEDLWKAVGAVAVLEILFGGLVAVSKFAGDAKNTMIGMSIAIAVLAVSLIALSFIEWDRLLPAAGALTMVMAAFAAMTAATGQVKKSMATIIVLAVVVAELAAILYVLSGLPWESTLASAGAMSMLILALSGAMYILGKADNVDMKTIGKVAVMAAIVGALGAVMGLLSKYDMNASITSAISLSILINAIAASMLILSKVDSLDWKLVEQFAIIVAVTAALGAVMGVLSKYDMDSSIQSAIALGILINAIAASMLILDHVGSISWKVIAQFEIISATVLAVGAILGLLHKFDFTTSIEEATALSILLIAMAGVTVILGKFGKGSLAGAAEGAAALDAVIAIIGVLLVGLGALMEYVPQAEEFIDNGIIVLEKVGTGIGTFFGSIVGSFGERVAASLPNIAMSLSLFMTGLQPFFIGAKQASGQVLDGVTNLAKAILIISAANIVDGIARWITGKSSMGKFVKSLSELGPALKEYSDEVGNGQIDIAAIKNSAEAAIELTKFAASIPRSGGLAQLLAGSKNITKFVKQLAWGDEDKNGKKKEGLAQALVDYSNTIKNANIDKDKIKESSEAAMALTEFAETIPSTGGLLQKIVGVKDLASFVKSISGDDENKGLAQALVDYSKTIKKGKIDVDAIKASAEAGKALAELEKALPERGGKLQQWLGDKETLTAFALSLVGDDKNIGFADAIVEYCKKVTNAGITEKTVEGSVNAAKALMGLEDNLPDSYSKLKTFFVGDKQTLTQFGSQLEAFGDAISKYADKIKNINPESVSTSANAARMLAETAKIVEVNDVDENTFDGFGSAITKLSDKIQNFYTSMEKIDSVKLSNAITNVDELVKMGKGVAGVNTDTIKKFGDSLEKMAKDGVNGFVKAFSDAETRVKNAAKTLLSNFITGADTKKGDVESGFLEIASTAIAAIMSSYSGFENAGIYVIAGFANGITNNKDLAEKAGRKAAEAALIAAQERLDENSPSKEFYKIGYFGVLGLANAMRDGNSLAYDAGYGMADNAVSGLRKAISGISDTIENDIDTQPTIRPVLDLSDIQNGTDYMDRVFSNRNLKFSAMTAGALTSDISANFTAKSDSDMLDRMSSIEARIYEVGTAISQMQVVMDSGALVGEIAAPMDKALGQRMVYAKRGV